MKKELVSVIIINWNGKHFLKDCLNSVLKSDYPNFEIVLVDCASRDGSVEYVKSEYKDKRIKLIELKKDPGFDPTNNLAVRKYAKGDSILLLNNDTKIASNLLSEMMKQVEDNCVLNPIQYNFESQFVLPYYEHIMIGKPVYKLLSLLNIYNKLFREKPKPFYASVACCLLKRNLFLKFPFNKNFNLYEDMLWGWELFLSGVDFKFVETTYYYHKIVGTTYKAKAGYNVGLAVSAAHYICLSLPVFLLVYPIIFLELLFYWTYLAIKTRSINPLLEYLRGIKTFAGKLASFKKEKQRLNKYRKYMDFYSFKRWVQGSQYTTQQQEKYSKNF